LTFPGFLGFGVLAARRAMIQTHFAKNGFFMENKKIFSFSQKSLVEINLFPRENIDFTM